MRTSRMEMKKRKKRMNEGEVVDDENDAEVEN